MSHFEWLQLLLYVIQKEFSRRVEKAFDRLQVRRKIMSNYLLYGSEMSYFSGKARAYLRWKGIDFEERNSDERFYNEVCIPRIGYPMIPLVITPDDQTIQDTTLIMDYFEQIEDAGPSLTASGPVQQLGLAQK